MDEKKFSFIICVNDELEFSECKFYLDRLSLPHGYKKDIITIQEAPSMAAGYNAGMNSTDAKYKVYLHQDIFIINQNFIIDLLNVFQKNSKIGIIGCIGSTQIETDAFAVTSWNIGNVYHNCSPMHLHFPFSDTDYPIKAEALDGMLLATQYDIPWREDLMDGWDFYDISQCMEFKRHGYDAAIPYQNTPWCYHDNQYSKMDNYHFYRQKFIKEYFDKEISNTAAESGTSKEFSELKKSSRKAMESLIQSGNRTGLQEIFLKPDNRGYLHLREYELIADIERLEQENNVPIHMWNTGIDLDDLLDKLRFLKFQIKRLEYKADHPTSIANNIHRYSKYARSQVCKKYVYDSEKILNELKNM